MKKPFLKKLIITIILIIIVLAILFGVWMYNLQKMIAEFSKPRPASTVTATYAKTQNWPNYLTEVGNLTAINGVMVTSKSSGMVSKILFKSGEMVQKNQALIQLSANTLLPQIQKAQAALVLAHIQYQRQLKLKNQNVISLSTFDQARATLNQAKAEVAYLQQTLANLSVRAPFSGKLGIRQIQLGQYIQPGTSIVSLQQITKLYANLNIPSNLSSKIHLGQNITVQSDAYPNQIFKGKVTAINSQISNQTKSLEIQATINNPKKLLIPGLFITAHIQLPVQKNIVTVPQTAVNYTLYGNSVYIIQKPKTSKNSKSKSNFGTAFQMPVVLGNSLNNQVQILKGLKKGQWVITTGQMKLHNGSAIRVVKGPK